MRAPALPLYKGVRNLEVVSAASDQAVRLQWQDGLAEASIISPGLFRLRMTTAKRFKDCSWAVARTAWPKAIAQVHVQDDSVSLICDGNNLSLQLSDGSWSLKRFAARHEEQMFQNVADESGYSDEGWKLVLRLAEQESLFGLGETTGTFNKRGLIREFWNIDVLGHAPAIHPSLRTLYVSIPFAISLRNRRSAGLFWDNPARQTWDLGQTRLDRWELKVQSGELDLYLFAGPGVSDVVRSYTELTGRMSLPPLWALGYHQCRYSYETRREVEAVAREFRRRRIPCDALYLDIHHMDGYRVFTFGKAFPKPAKMLARLRNQGFKVVTIVDPGVKQDPKFGVLQRGIAAQAFVREPDGKKDFIGRVWPGLSRYPDFLNRRAREWWGHEQRSLQETGVAGFWNDMNEPANFGSPTKTLPEECLHTSDSGPVRHAEGHNVYGSEMARASREGALSGRPNQRPFVISRAGYAGVQRHALVWTGDNSSLWEHLGDGLQMWLNLGLSGVAFCGGDVGGFLDNATPELLTRWTQVAAFTPFFRNHSNIRTLRQEPWALGRQTERICRSYINLRYRLLPYLYCLFAEACAFGTPVMRPLLWHYQDDVVAASTGDQFMLGSSLLIAPILRQGAVARSVYLPEGTWHDFWTGERHAGEQHIVAKAPLEKIPLFVRSGAIVPMWPVRQFVHSRPPSTVELHIWTSGPGDLVYYEDDGSSMEHVSGKFRQRTIAFQPRAGDGGLVRFSEARGEYHAGTKKWRLVAEPANRVAPLVELRDTPEEMSARVGGRTQRN